MAVHVNTATLTVGYNITTPNPVDGRTIVNVKTDLIDDTKWNKTVEFYNGLPVFVQSTQELYYLLDKEHALVTLESATADQIAAAYACWGRMASEKDLEKAVQDLGPVFIFKGVAKSVSPDRRVITLDTVNYTPNGSATAVDLVCLGYEYGFPDKYYAWGTIDASTSALTTYFYSEDPVVTVSSEQYKKGSTATAIYYVDDASLSGKRYYFDTSVANQDPEAETGSEVMWMFTDELDMSHIYCVATGGADAPSADANNVIFYLDPDTSKEEYAELNIAHFNSYKFTKIPSSQKGTINSSTGSTVTAGDSNNGWVYQIDEDEYASNGMIWVQLGSAENEWIII